MVCCLNPDCEKPLNPGTHKYCQTCGTGLIALLLNRFQITQPLGRGGFGKTYLAVDTHKLDEKCVVKQLVYLAQGSQANQQVINLFMQEAKQLQQLWANPQIPSLFAYFEEDSYLYLVQQYIEGQNLLKELQIQGCFKEQKIHSLLKDLLPVFEEIHNRQVIHRDIKPENIMRRHSDGKLILIDFGVSKQLSQSIVSMAGTMVGSLGYAAPEQMESGIAHPASDLYSLGASCFHLMTAINPWSLWKRQGYGWLSQWRMHLQQPISLELEGVLDKLLQIEIIDRYQSASAVLADLTPSPQATPQATIPLVRPQPYPQKARFPTPSPQFTPGPIPKSSVEPPPVSLTQNPPYPSPSVSLSPINPAPSPSIQKSHKIHRRQFLIWTALGGASLGSVLAWKSIRDSSQSSDSVVKPGSTPSESSSPRPFTESSLARFSFEVVSVNGQGKIINRSQKQAQFFAEVLGNGTKLEMVSIPGGRFTMGSPASELRREDDEGPQHQVSVPEFYIGKYPVTQSQWQAIMGSNPSKFKGANRPVEQVTWEDAIEFCQKLSQKSGKDYRLPSEAEWEYACRSGTTSPFYLGETITSDLANYDGTATYGSGPKGEYRKQTTDVGSFSPNAFGLYDMHGNVWEWCQDSWHDGYSEAPTDGSAWVDSDSRYRVLRSGSYNCNPKCCRCASRIRHRPIVGHDSDGFRVAFSAPNRS